MEYSALGAVVNPFEFERCRVSPLYVFEALRKERRRELGAWGQGANHRNRGHRPIQSGAMAPQPEGERDHRWPLARLAPTRIREQVRPQHPRKDDFGLTRYDLAPNTLESEEFPQDHIDPPAGPIWRPRALIRPFSGAGHQDAQREERAAVRLAAPAAGESRLRKAIASMAAQLAKPKAEEASTPAPSVDDQLYELALEQEREFPTRPIERRTRRSIDRYVAYLPKGA